MRAMRSIGLMCGVIAALQLVAHGEEVNATPFWEQPKVEIGGLRLRPADVKLVAGPERGRELALLQIGTDDPRNYVTKVSSKPAEYRLVSGGLQVGAPIYVDREYAITQLSDEWVGLPLLQTVLQHKPVLDGRFAIVLATSKPCLVFVAADENALETYERHGVPAWLQEYSPTDGRITTDRAKYLVFVKKIQAGRISLGPPCLDANANTMYFAFFAGVE